MTQEFAMDDMNEGNRHLRVIDRLDTLRDWPFFVILWLLRWPIVMLLSPLQYGLAILFYGAAEPELLKGAMNVSATQQFIGGVIVMPFIVVAIECVLPYLPFARRPRRARPWWYIGLSAFIMVLLTPLAAFPCAFATGLFLAYCFAHYAQESMWKAYGFTVLYLALINLVGVLMMALGIFSM
ncbi:MAG: hypothetical protein AMXMBFR82_28260 [Candidatus Hydrogenedentota bacterium]